MFLECRLKVFFISDFDGYKVGEVKEVSEGYAKNFLIPRKVAIVYDASVDFRVKTIAQKKEVVEKKRSGLFDDIERLVLTIPVTVRDDVLFGSVFQNEIKESLQEHSIVVSKSQILLDKPLKKLGLFKVPIKLSNTLIPVLRVKLVSKK
jgi:large subunit ribosomal protein L9